MFKYLSICAALFSLAAGPLYAQEREAMLRTVQVPGAGFDLIVATPDPEGGALPNLRDTAETLVVHLQGGKLALVFDDPWKMVKAFDLLRTPVGAFEAPATGGNSPEPIALYIVPRGDTTVSSWHTTKVQAGANPRRPAALVSYNAIGLP